MKIICYSHKCVWQVYDAVMEYMLVDTEQRKNHLVSLFEEIQWPLIRTKKYSYIKSILSIKPMFISDYLPDLISPTRYYLDSLNDPFIMDNPKCAAITEQAYVYFKLPYQDKVTFWKDKPRPSRWPQLLAVLSYAEKLLGRWRESMPGWFTACRGLRLGGGGVERAHREAGARLWIRHVLPQGVREIAVRVQ